MDPSDYDDEDFNSGEDVSPRKGHRASGSGLSHISEEGKTPRMSKIAHVRSKSKEKLAKARERRKSRAAGKEGSPEAAEGKKGNRKLGLA